MLFGTEIQQKDIIKQANKFADSNGMKLVFGAMVGSVSKGLQYADSDYDTRFLYLREDFPQKICIPSQMSEEELVKRYYFTEKVYEWIPFWEMTSFLQFLDNPSFFNDFSVGLYNIVGWTFMSPYVWDPYGIQSKLMPLMNTIFNSKYEVAYHSKVLEKYRPEFGKEQVITKSYLYAVHAAATIEWSIVYNVQPPIDLQSLLIGLNHIDVWTEVEKILKDAREQVRRDFVLGNTELHDAHFSIATPKNKIIEAYVQQAMELQCPVEKVDREQCKNIINNMYDIIYRSVYENEDLLYSSV